MKCKNLYINKKGNINSYNALKDKLNSLNKLYVTNNICESIHALISKNLPKTRVTKNNFRETLNYIIKMTTLKEKNIVRRDYITRTLITIILKYDLNKEYKPIDYSLFKNELGKVIAIMTGKINIKGSEELVNSIENPCIREAESIEHKDSQIDQNKEVSIDENEEFLKNKSDDSDILNKSSSESNS